MGLTTPELVVHLFARTAPTPPEPAQRTTSNDSTGPAPPGGDDETELLAQVWLACTSPTGLRMTEPLSLPGVRPDPPGIAGVDASDGPDTAGRPVGPVVAARTAPGPAVRQVMWISDHDVTCLSLVLSRSDPTTWTDLYGEWAAATGGIDLRSLLGQVEVFTALASAGSVDTSHATTNMLTSSLPEPVRPGDSTWPTAVVTPPGIAIWQLTATDSLDPLRRLVAVAPAGHDRQLSTLTWSHGRPTTVPLTRYLLHAAKLRHQARLRDGERRLGHLHHQVTTTLHELRPLFGAASATVADAELDRADRALTRLEAGENGLIDASYGVTSIRRTAQIAASNMRLHTHHILQTGGLQVGGADYLLPGDRELTAWLDAQLDDDATYLAAARDRAHHLAAAAAHELQRRRDQREQMARHRQERLILLQTGVIGAILMGLTAIQALSYRVPLPAPAKPGFIAALGALALHLYVLALARHTTHSDRARPAGLGWLAPTAAGLLAATTTWLATSWTTYLVFGPGNAAPASVTIPIAISAFAVVVVSRLIRPTAPPTATGQTSTSG